MSSLAQLRESSDAIGEDQLHPLLEGVKDPLSSWLDGKVYNCRRRAGL